MNDNDTLNGNGDGDAKGVDARFLVLLHRYYTVAMLTAWIEQARAGMRTRPGQVARWQRTREWLQQSEGVGDVS